MLFQEEMLPKVALPLMNETHIEEIELVNGIYDLLTTTQNFDHALLLEKLDEFLVHVEHHFLSENNLMQDFNFPALHCHKAEHERVLNILKFVVDRYISNHDEQELKDFFEHDFRPWIENHIQTMDFVTANYLQQLI